LGVGTVGRSEPAFHGCQHLCTPPHLPARREADVIWQLFLLRSRPTEGHSFVLRPEPDGESAGCVLPAVPCSAGCVLPALPLCLPCPLPSSSSCPHSTVCSVHLLYLLAPVHDHVQFVFNTNQHVCKLRDCPVGSNNAGLQWRPAHRAGFFAPWPVQQDCHLGSRFMETAFGQPMRAATTHKKGRPGTAFGQPAKVPHTSIP